VATELYEHKNRYKVYDFGLMPHPIHRFLGASPDGITSDGRMLEIKVPLSRKLSGRPPLHYWIQMQMQMECCDLDVCDFVECKISEYPSENAYLNDTFMDEEGNSIYGLTQNGLNKGCVLVITYHNGDDTKRSVMYSPMASQMNDHHDMLGWVKDSLFNLASENDRTNLLEMVLQEGTMSVERCWWRLDEYSQIEIQRDKRWFQKRLPDFEEFWSNVEKFRESGLPASLQTTAKETVTSSQTTFSSGGNGGNGGNGGSVFNTNKNGCLIILDDDNNGTF
jgi:hypothetical protein